MKILSLIGKDKTKYKNKLKNLEKYKILLDQNTAYKDIKYKVDDLVITPINDQLKDLKLDYLKQRSKKDLEAFKTYIINKSNYLLNEGKNIDTQRLSKLWEDAENSKQIKKLENLYNDLINK